MANATNHKLLHMELELEKIYFFVYEGNHSIPCDVFVQGLLQSAIRLSTQKDSLVLFRKMTLGHYSTKLV